MFMAYQIFDEKNASLYSFNNLEQSLYFNVEYVLTELLSTYILQ